MRWSRVEGGLKRNADCPTARMSFGAQANVRRRLIMAANGRAHYRVLDCATLPRKAQRYQIIVGILAYPVTILGGNVWCHTRVMLRPNSSELASFRAGDCQSAKYEGESGATLS